MKTAQEKRCSRCRKTKPAKDFWPSKITRDGLYWYCKKCEVERCEARRRAMGQSKRQPSQPKRKRLTKDAKIAEAAKALEAVSLALELMAHDRLSLSLLKTTQQAVRQTLEAIGGSEVK